MPVGGKHIARACHEETVDIAVAKRRLEAAVRKGDASEGTVTQQQVEQTTVGVHDHVNNPRFCIKIVDVDDVRVVVGVEEEQLVVDGEVQDARFGVHRRGVQVESVGPERHEWICRRQGFDDHAGDFCIGWKVPAGTRIAVWVQPSGIGLAGCETVGFTKHTKSAPIKQGRAHAVNHQVRFFDGHAVLAAGPDFQ